MEGLWILVGSALSTASGVIFWYLNSRGSQKVQARQIEADRERQERQIQAERQNAKDDAVRSMKRERLQPVFTVRSELDDRLAHHLLMKTFDSTEDAAIFDQIAIEVFGGSPPTGMVEQFKKRMRRDFPRPGVDVLAREITEVNKIGDEDLRRDIRLLIVAIWSAGPDSNLILLGSNLAGLHYRLEQYAGSVD